LQKLCLRDADTQLPFLERTFVRKFLIKPFHCFPHPTWRIIPSTA
jgi:hypothetical protein